MCLMKGHCYKGKDNPPPPREGSAPLWAVPCTSAGEQVVPSPCPHRGHVPNKVDAWTEVDVQIGSEAHPAFPRALAHVERDGWCPFEPTGCSSLPRGTCPGR